MSEHPGDHTADPVGHSGDEFHAAELQERWLEENPNHTADDYSAWKQANSSSSSTSSGSVFDAWADGIGREVQAQDQQAAADLRLASAIADAEARAAGWAHAKAQFAEAPTTQLWTRLAEPDLTPLRTALGVTPTGTVPGLDAAQALARRSARSLVSLCTITRQAADRAIAATNMANRSTNSVEPARQEYQNQFQRLADAVTAWQDVVADNPNPSADALTGAAADVATELQNMLIVHKKLESAYAQYNEAVPDTIAVGVRLNLAALSGEVARQFAPRGAYPQASLMYDRIGEDPRRNTDQTMWDTETLAGLNGNPRALSDLIVRHMQAMAADRSLSDHTRHELAMAVGSRQLPKLNDAMKRWQAAFDPSRPDLAGMAEATNSLMFTLSGYRDALRRADLNLVDLITLSSPIDALQQHLQQVLQALLRPRSGGGSGSAVSSSGSSSSSSSSSSGGTP